MHLGHTDFILAFDDRSSSRRCSSAIEGDHAGRPRRWEHPPGLQGMSSRERRRSTPNPTGTVDRAHRRQRPEAVHAAPDLRLATPVEQVGQNPFDFKYGESFGDHTSIRPGSSARCSCATTPTGARPTSASSPSACGACPRLHEHAAQFLFELWCPPSAPSSHGRRRHRPLRRRAGPDLCGARSRPTSIAGCEDNIWKNEGVEQRAVCKMLVAHRAPAAAATASSAPLIGRGADDAKVDHWLAQAAPVDGFIGFAIGR